MGIPGFQGVCETRAPSHLLLICTLLLPAVAWASPDEAYGVVTNVVDGNAFDVTLEKSDSRIAAPVLRVRMADVEAPELYTSQGTSARDYVFAVLMNKRVYLDIDDQSSSRDPQDSLRAVVYLTGYYGQPLVYPNFNRMMVDSGHAVLKNSTDNEFNPSDWWYEGEGKAGGFVVEGALQNILGQLEQSAKREVDSSAKDIWNKLWGQPSH